MLIGFIILKMEHVLAETTGRYSCIGEDYHTGEDKFSLMPCFPGVTSYQQSRNSILNSFYLDIIYKGFGISIDSYGLDQK